MKLGIIGTGRIAKRAVIDQEKSEYMNVEDYLRGLGYFLAEGIAEKALC